MIKWNMKLMYDYCKKHGYHLPKENQEYTVQRKKYIYICPKHGEYKQSWSDHKVGHGCKKCQYEKINKKDLSYFEKRLKDKFKNTLTINSIFREDKKVLCNVTCVKHNITYTNIVNDMLDKRRGNHCPKCSNYCKVANRKGKTKKKIPKDYYDECVKLGVDLPIEDYRGNNKLIKHVCKNGHVYLQEPNVHLRGYGCSICSDNYKPTPQEYYNRCEQLGIDLPIEPYVNNSTKIEYMCDLGHIYKQTPNNHYIYGCPICKESHGEKFIRVYLDKHNIPYESQKKFHDLKDKALLSYDFYLPNQKVLIEYQGIQHFESISFDSKNYTDLKKQQYHDKLKREYAKDNGYTLLEPTYKLNTQEKINNYLDKHL